jgi:hypothetical protein
MKTVITRAGLGSMNGGIIPLVLKNCQISNIAATGINGSQLRRLNMFIDFFIN